MQLPVASVDGFPEFWGCLVGALLTKESYLLGGPYEGYLLGFRNKEVPFRVLSIKESYDLGGFHSKASSYGVCDIRVSSWGPPDKGIPVGGLYCGPLACVAPQHKPLSNPEHNGLETVGSSRGI